MESPPVSDSASQTSKPVHPQACVVCSQRKVKCDREEPCSNCIKSEIHCVYRAPLPRGPRKRKLNDDDLRQRLERYEQLFSQFGIDPDLEQEDEKHPIPVRVKNSAGPEPFAVGKLMTVDGNPRYVEAKLWQDVANEIKDHEHLPKEDCFNANPEYQPYGLSDGAALLLGLGSSKSDLAALRPSPSHAHRLWQTYLSNADPLVKLLHTPSVHKLLQESIQRPTTISKTTDALLFSLYLNAINSLSDEQCLNDYGETRAVLLARYQTAAGQALVESRFLRSPSIILLQAYGHFLIGMRNSYDPRTMWVMTGTAIRICQGMGLHRDGSELNLSPFESEIRRRIWWRLVSLDARSSEIAGSLGSLFDVLMVAVSNTTTKCPANLEDSDLRPDMTSLPPDRVGSTSMFFAKMGYDTVSLARSWQNVSRAITRARSGKTDLYDPETSSRDADAELKEAEDMIETKYIRYCDPLKPLDQLITIGGRAMLCKRRFRMSVGRLEGGQVSQATAEELLRTIHSNALRAVEYYNLFLGSHTMQGFNWHTRAYYPSDTLLWLLSDLRNRPLNPEADHTWSVIQVTYTNYSEFIEHPHKVIHVALMSVCLKAWRARQAARPNDFGIGPSPTQCVTPDFVKKLQAMQDHREAALRAKHSTKPEDPRRFGNYSSSIDQAQNFMTQNYQPYLDGIDPSFLFDPVLDAGPEGWAQFDQYAQQFGFNG